jgi:hypothetical protein
MGNGFSETSVNKIDVKKFDENFNKIDWSAGQPRRQVVPDAIVPICNPDLSDKIEPGRVELVPVKKLKLTLNEFHEIYYSHAQDNYDELKKKYVGE